VSKVQSKQKSQHTAA